MKRALVSVLLIASLVGLQAPSVGAQTKAVAGLDQSVGDSVPVNASPSSEVPSDAASLSPGQPETTVKVQGGGGQQSPDPGITSPTRLDPPLTPATVPEPGPTTAPVAPPATPTDPRTQPTTQGGTPSTAGPTNSGALPTQLRRTAHPARRTAHPARRTAHPARRTAHPARRAAPRGRGSQPTGAGPGSGCCRVGQHQRHCYG